MMKKSVNYSFFSNSYIDILSTLTCVEPDVSNAQVLVKLMLIQRQRAQTTHLCWYKNRKLID